MLLVIILVLISIFVSVFFYGFEKSLVFLSLKRVDSVKINGNSNLILGRDTYPKPMGSQTLIRNNLQVGDYVEHSSITVTNNRIVCGTKTRIEINGMNIIPEICSVKYVGIICEDQDGVPSDKVRVSWIGYVKGGEFVNNVGSCSNTCRNCAVSNIVNVSFLEKIDKEHISIASRNPNNCIIDGIYVPGWRKQKTQLTYLNSDRKIPLTSNTCYAPKGQKCCNNTKENLCTANFQNYNASRIKYWMRHCIE